MFTYFFFKKCGSVCLSLNLEPLLISAVIPARSLISVCSPHGRVDTCVLITEENAHSLASPGQTSFD